MEVYPTELSQSTISSVIEAPTSKVLSPVPAAFKEDQFKIKLSKLELLLQEGDLDHAHGKSQTMRSIQQGQVSRVVNKDGWESLVMDPAPGQCLVGMMDNMFSMVSTTAQAVHMAMLELQDMRDMKKLAQLEKVKNTKQRKMQRDVAAAAAVPEEVKAIKFPLPKEKPCAKVLPTEKPAPATKKPAAATKDLAAMQKIKASAPPPASKKKKVEAPVKAKKSLAPPPPPPPEPPIKYALHEDSDLCDEESFDSDFEPPPAAPATKKRAPAAKKKQLQNFLDEPDMSPPPAKKKRAPAEKILFWDDDPDEVHAPKKKTTCHD